MSTITERPAQPEIVLVVCSGIACPTGFSLNPDGYPGSYVDFMPGIAAPLARHYADWIVAQDPTRFEIVKPAKEAANTDKPVKTAKAAKK